MKIYLMYLSQEHTLMVTSVHCCSLIKKNERNTVGDTSPMPGYNLYYEQFSQPMPERKDATLIIFLWKQN